MNEQEKKQLAELIQWKKNLESSNTIPLLNEQALRGRFIFSSITTSTKSATSEAQAVNEAGAAAYGVLKNPDSFVQFSIGQTVYYIPVFN